MPNGGDSPVISRTVSGSLANSNLTELDEARGIASYRRRARVRQSSALVGDVAARDYIRNQYRERAKQIVIRRANNVPVFDHLYEVAPGEFVVAEGKANQSPFGRTNRQWREFRTGPGGGAQVISHVDRKAVVQFSPEWFDQRLTELRRDFGPEGNRLANRLEHSWREGKLRAIAIRAPEAGRTAEHVVITDVSNQWNAHVGAPNRHTMPIDRRPKIITDPARLVSGPPTNVERGLEVAEARIPEPNVPGARASAAENLVQGAQRAAGRGVTARSLVIGVKVWRAARTVGKVVVICFVPLKLLDVALEVALALFDREREKEAKKRREKRRALEAVLRDDSRSPTKLSLPALIQRDILSNSGVQDQFMKHWDMTGSYPGFQYARLHAVVRIETYRDIRGEDHEALTTVRAESREVRATDWAHDFALTDISEKVVEKTEADIRALLNKGVMYPSRFRKIVKRKRLKYTMVPPLLTPYDIVLTKINNLFVDVVQFTAYFTDAGREIFARPFQFDYRTSWQAQFEVVPDFSHRPLNASVCEYCLAYLFYAGKQLSRHPLEQQDLEGNLEDPTKGWRRRFWLLMALLEGAGTSHGRNFSYFGEQLKRLVRQGEKSHEVLAALEELYTGARAIWYDLQRIERNMSKSEYYYLGPNYTPPSR